ncbi:MAG TPA: cupin domain-containing protein, partial [Actinobacteria bacterium]|nr:cupin domain-containing protein [Actinomycetota bacterium]
MSIEDLARRRFRAEGLEPQAWSNGPRFHYPSHAHPYGKLLVCVAGSITFHTPDGDVELGPGDWLDLPAGTAHSATVGP